MSYDQTPLDRLDWPDLVRFGGDGLVPVAVQSSQDQQVLLVGTMNREALARTLATGRLWLWSRSRQQLWLKGETSGHFQQVDAIYINCELNSLLVEVTGHGPICHTGHPTCFYRQVTGGGRATQSSFDSEALPSRRTSQAFADAQNARTDPAGATLEDKLRQLYQIYEYLRDADLRHQSRTARLLYAPDPVLLRTRLADELGELAGVADGTHRHAGLPSDAILEASQVCYWTYLLAVTARLPYATLAPHIHLAAPAPTNSLAAARHGRELAAAFAQEATPISPLVLQEVLRHVATICDTLSVSPVQVVDYDLAQMRERSYLADFFAAPPQVQHDQGSGT